MNSNRNGNGLAPMKLPALLAAALALLVSGLQGGAQTVTTFSFTNINRALPDGNASGLIDVQTLASNQVYATSVRLKLHIVGEFNGDLYGYLRRVTATSTNFCVLLNRVGRSSTNAFGYQDSGMDVVLDDAAAGNIHTYQSITNVPPGSPLTGAWKPDGRTNDPSVVLDTNVPDTTLSSFANADVGGQWTLYLADLHSGATNFLTGWELEFNGTAVPVSITSNPQSVTVDPGDSAAFSVAVSGTPPFSYQWHFNGGDLTGETNASITVSNAGVGNIGAYSVSVSNVVNQVTSTTATLNLSDIIPPTIAITAPSDFVLTNTTVAISGTATDNVGVVSVYLSLNGGAFALATGSTNWPNWSSAAITLPFGTNVVLAYSVDLSGNRSPTNSQTYFETGTNRLALFVHGLGTVQGAHNLQPVVPGQTYVLTATPSANFVFSNWVVTSQSSGDYVSTSSKLSLVMQPGLVVTANFTTNPFTASVGQFTGLFYDTNGVALPSSGFFRFTLTKRGKYTAALFNAGRRSSASGRISLLGGGTNYLRRRGANPLAVTWQVDLTGSDEITGTVSDGTWQAELSGDRAVFDARTLPCTNAGRYTFVLPGTPGDPLQPEGDGYGTVVIKSNGIVNVHGYLADNTAFARMVPLSKDGEWPLYNALYSRQGMVLSWIQCSNQLSDDFEGSLVWIRSTMANRAFYPLGFTNQTAMTGSRYVPPPGLLATGFGLTNGLVSVTGGNLTAPGTNVFSLGLRGRIINLSSNALSGSLNLANGLFTGKLTPAGADKPVVFRGAWLQKPGYGSGYFKGTNEVGRVLLENSP